MGRNKVTFLLEARRSLPACRLVLTGVWDEYETPKELSPPRPLKWSPVSDSQHALYPGALFRSPFYPSVLLAPRNLDVTWMTLRT